jgi:hypothetical protein
MLSLVLRVSNSLVPGITAVIGVSRFPLEYESAFGFKNSSTNAFSTLVGRSSAASDGSHPLCSSPQNESAFQELVSEPSFV